MFRLCSVVVNHIPDRLQILIPMRRIRQFLFLWFRLFPREGAEMKNAYGRWGRFHWVPFRTGAFSAFILVFLLLGSIFVEAAEIKLNGELRYRAFYSDNLSDAHDHNGPSCPDSDGTLDQSCDDQEAFSDLRFRAKMTASQGIASGVVMVDFLSQVGTDVATLSATSGRDETGNWRLGSEGSGDDVTTVVLREAYLRVTLPWFTAQAGRHAIHLGHSLIFDDVADAITLAIPAGPVGITFGNLKLVESATKMGTSSSDSDIYFANASWTVRPTVVTSLFFLTLQDRGPSLTLHGVCQDPAGVPPAFQSCAVEDLGNDRAQLLVGGLTLDIKRERFYLGFEVDLLQGGIETRDITDLNPGGNNLDLKGLNALLELEFRWPFLIVGLTGVYASGQDVSRLDDEININAISANYVLGNILVNNEMDSDRDGGSIGGLTAVRLSLQKNLRDQLVGEFVVIWARMTERPAPGIDPELGWEFDLNATYTFDDYLVWVSGIGFLLVDEAWEGVYGDPFAEDNLIKVSTKFIFTF